MNQTYVDTVRLLLAIAPTVFQSQCFAMKGGTALNLFEPGITLDEETLIRQQLAQFTYLAISTSVEDKAIELRRWNL